MEKRISNWFRLALGLFFIIYMFIEYGFGIGILSVMVIFLLEVTLYILDQIAHILKLIKGILSRKEVV